MNEKIKAGGSIGLCSKAFRVGNDACPTLGDTERERLVQALDSKA